MGKVCLANQIGTDACWLLATVVFVEDARRYRGAVTFFNEQLMQQVGAKSHDTLARVRYKAIAAGWLHYERGSKSVAGRYWVTVPNNLIGFDDGAADENPAEYAVTYRCKYGRTTPDDPGSYPATLRHEPERKCVMNPSASAYHSSLSFPDPKDTPAAAPRLPTELIRPTPERKPKPDHAKSSDTPHGHAEAVAGYCDAWQGKYGVQYPFAGSKDGAAVKAMLKYVGGDVTKFLAAAARFLADADPFYGGHTLAKFSQYFARWIAPPPAAPARYAYDEPD